MTMLQEGDLSNGQPLAPIFSSQSSLHRKGVALKMLTAPESDLSVSSTWTQPSAWKGRIIPYIGMDGEHTKAVIWDENCE